MGLQPQLCPYVILRSDDATAGLAKLVKRSAVMVMPNADNAEDDTYSESHESESSNSSDDLVLLDEQPSDWEEPAWKRRKLSVVAGASPEDEVMALQEQLAKMEELRLRAEQECQTIRCLLYHTLRSTQAEVNVGQCKGSTIHLVIKASKMNRIYMLTSYVIDIKVETSFRVWNCCNENGMGRF
ncbi:hypothetical protein BDR03DRAFT_1038375 [Suillus americanus]|nr:hypothetical protein BDR03DRAFT_1038375 [Suillus americanus]